MIKIYFLFLMFGVSAFAEIDFVSEIESMKSIGSLKFDKIEKADIIFIDFWASWCEPCKESFPFYDGFLKKQNRRKILFISVNLDDKIEKAQSFLKEFPQGHVTVWDEKKKLMAQVGFDSIPYLLILDKNWKVLKKINGFNDKAKKTIEDYL